MPSATVTIRKLRNADSGVDLSVPTHKESPGLLTTTVDYHVVVVSNQPVFKSPKHKDTDVVQFMVSKRYEDFENLRRKLISSFHGTVFPQLPKSLFSFGDSAINERRSALDGFLKFIASRSKCVLSRHTLEFLGVEPLKIKSYEVVSEDDRPPHHGLFEDEPTKPTPPRCKRKPIEPIPAADLFGCPDSEEADNLFLAAVETIPECGPRTEMDDILFTETTIADPESGGLKLFATQDFGDKVGDDKDLFLLPRKQPEPASEPETMTADDTLLSIDDDISRLLSIGRKPPTPEKPRVPPKPSPKGRPIPERTTSDKGKALKPQLAPKPKKVQRKPEPLQASEIGSDDILNYIRENTNDSASDLDLFS